MELVALVVLVATTAAVVGVILWASRRGLDLTDEGFALLSTADPRADAANFSQFAVLVDVVLGPWQPGVTGYRLIRLGLLAGSAALLGSAFAGFCTARLPRLAALMPRRSLVVGFVVLAGLLGYSWLPNALSYNDVNTTLVHVQGALLLRLGAAGDERLSRWRSAAALALGGLVALQVFVKWSSALAVLGLVVVALLGWSGLRRGSWACAAVMGGVGLTLVVVSAEGLGGPFRLDALLAATEITSTGATHDPAEVLEKYARTLVDTVVTVLVSSWWRVPALVMLLAGAGLVAAVVRPVRSAGIVAWSASSAAVTVLLVEAGRLAATGSGYVLRGLQGELLVSVLLACGLAALLVRWAPEARARDGRRTRWTTVGVLVGLPFAAAFGTASSLVLHGTTAAAGLGCTILLTVATARRTVPPRLPPVHALAPATLAALFAVMIVHGTVVEPYRVPTSLLEQSLPVEGVPRLEGLRVDPGTAAFVGALHDVVMEDTGFRSGDPILALSHMPGLVYALGGTAPGPVWIDYPLPGRQERTCAGLRTAPDAVADTDLVLVNSAVTAEMEACLDDLLPGWPEEFEERGSVESSYTGIMGLYAPTVRVLAR